MKLRAWLKLAAKGKSDDIFYNSMSGVPENWLWEGDSVGLQQKMF